ncbi:YraN family protein [Chamaesiphon sp.]|uniref:YraN family protein n=1 Tax=Chamaesiphon sp. TaxID=2814140 RepID=UPI003594893A
MNTGKQGEEIVVQWLIDRGGKILYHRWRWQRGEIDLIAIESDTLLFIEVKTRKRSNWDTDGLLAITPQKQAKILTAAALFLAKHPYLADYPCRFDVAIVRHQPMHQPILGTPLHISTDIAAGVRLLLVDYLVDAFDVT